jgi:hypothetical protein
MYRLHQFLVLLIGSICFHHAHAQSEVHRLQAPITNYGVSSVIHSNGFTLLSGSFYQMGKFSGSGVVLDNATGIHDGTWPVLSGNVYAVVPDGNGGWYVGGSIYTVDNVDYGNLVHLLPNKTLDKNWKPNPLGSVRALALDNGVLYIGGYFLTIANESRKYAAAIDLTTGALTAWAPAPNNYVSELSVGDNAVYMAGGFSKINDGASDRVKVAAVNKTTGTVVTAWQLTLNGTGASVETILVNGATVYVGGTFTGINGVSRAGLAAVSATDGTVNSTWDPAPASTSGTPAVESIVLNGNTLYVAGYFNAGLGRLNTIKHLGAVSTTGAGDAIASFVPVLDVGDRIYSIKLTGTTLYISGFFNSVNSLTRYGLAALNTTNASPTAWAPQLSGADVETLSLSGSQVFIGGDIRGVNWSVYDGFAVMEESSGLLLPLTFNITSGEDIFTMVVKGTTMYLGGRFTSVKGVARKNLAAIDLTTGTVLPWNPGASGTTATFENSAVLTMDIKDNTVYVGGIFLTVGGASRTGLAAIDATTGIVTAWNPVVGPGSSTSEYPRSIHIKDNLLYVAGRFTKLAGANRTYIGALDLFTGAPTAWSPVATDDVTKVRAATNVVYVVGDFTGGIGGTTRSTGIAALDITSGLATEWNPAFSSSIADFAFNDTDLYVCGYFDAVSTDNRPGLASFSLATGNLNPWTPDLGSSGEGAYIVESVAISPNRIYVGGGFQYVGNEKRVGYAEYDMATCTAIANIALDGTVLSASAGDSYQWYENDVLIVGANEQTYTINPTEYGKYAVEVTSGDCSARSADYIYLVTGDEPSLSSQLKVYPNPAVAEILVEVPVKANVVVTDVTGKPVEHVFVNEFVKNKIITSAWPNGVYILHFTAGTQNASVKIIKTN